MKLNMTFTWWDWVVGYKVRLVEGQVVIVYLPLDVRLCRKLFHALFEFISTLGRRSQAWWVDAGVGVVERRVMIHIITGWRGRKVGRWASRALPDTSGTSLTGVVCCGVAWHDPICVPKALVNWDWEMLQRLGRPCARLCRGVIAGCLWYGTQGCTPRTTLVNRLAVRV